MSVKTLRTRRAAVHAVVLLALLLSVFVTSVAAMGSAAIPTGLTAIWATDGAFSDRVQVSWAPLLDATYYEVYRNTSDDSAAAVLLGSPALPPFDDMTVTPETTYWYFVKACNVDGCSAFSPSDSGFSTAAVVIPAAPTNVAATDGTFIDHVDVSWDAVTGAAYYEVYNSAASSDPLTAGLLASTTFSPYSDMSVTPGALYWYFVKACNEAGCSDFSAFDTGFAGELVTSTFILYSDGWQDGWVVERSETASKGGKFNNTAAVMRLGDNKADKQYRSILSFDTSTLPDGIYIVGATLEIRRNRVDGQNPFYTHGKLIADIASPYFGTTVDLAAEDFQAAAAMLEAATFSKKPDITRWYSAIVDPAAFAYFNFEGTTQFRLEYKRGDNDDMSKDNLKFFSGDGPAEFRPMLIIEYYEP